MYKGAQKTFYNIDAIAGQDSCVIVEGEVDAMSFHEAGVTNVVSVPNGFNATGQVNLDYLTDFYSFFEDKDKIFVAVDNDEAGRTERKNSYAGLVQTRYGLLTLATARTQTST